MSIRDSVLARAQTPTPPVPVETAHGTAYVRKLSTREWQDFRDNYLDKSDAEQVARIATDQFGTPLFTAADVPFLDRLPAGEFAIPVRRKFFEVMGIDGPKASPQPADSPTASPPTSGTPT